METNSRGRTWLRRLDFALASKRAASNGCALHHVCPECDNHLCETISPALHWCGGCRRVYHRAAGRLLCEVPKHWRPQRLFAYWERAMAGLRGCEDDLAFTRYFCDREGKPLESAMSGDLRIEPDQIRIGRLALDHRLLTRSDVAWVLRYQRSVRTHRRRCFGEIAAALGLWSAGVAPRLLAVQAERRRGLTHALAKRIGVEEERLLVAERQFFGVDPDGSPRGIESPFDAMMAA